MKSRLPLALLIPVLASRARPPLKTVPKVVLPRFMGDWHVFAHIPYSLEKGKVGTLDRYALLPDGRIQKLISLSPRLARCAAGGMEGRGLGA